MNFVTYFDKNYIPKFSAMADSLLRHEKKADLWAFACDSESRGALDGHNVWGISVGKLEKVFPELCDARGNREWVEYMWTLTPFVMQFMMLEWKLEEIAYVDADLYFFSDLGELYTEAGDNDICAIPHRWSPEHSKRLATNGKYNVSWLRVLNTEEGVAFLKEWGDLCIDSCIRDNKCMGDQGHIDYLERVYDIYDIQHLGANLAPWSQKQYNYHMEDGQVYVEQDKLLFYHLHEFLHSDNGSTLRRTGYDLHPFVAEHVYPEYEAKIKRICGGLG